MDDACGDGLEHVLNVIFNSLNDHLPGWDPAEFAVEVAARLRAADAVSPLPVGLPPRFAPEALGLGEEWRPWCCPEPRCVPVHTLSGSENPLSQAEPGETFVCFGAAPTVEFVYDGARHVNDTRSCTYTPLKGVISYQENADDWRALSNAYSRATTALLRLRNGDQGARNP